MYNLRLESKALNNSSPKHNNNNNNNNNNNKQIKKKLSKTYTSTVAKNKIKMKQSSPGYG